jgi:hypothetical protein
MMTNAVMAQIARNKMAAQQAVADQKAMWQAHGPATQDDRAFNQANDQNMPAPTVQQLAQQVALRDKALQAAKAQAQAPAPVDPAMDPGAKAALAAYDKLMAARQPDFGASKTALAMKALQKISGKPEKSSGPATQPSAPPPATGLPNGNAAAPEAPQVAPSAPPVPPVPTITVTHRGYSVERPVEGIKNEHAYRAAVQKNIATRADLADDLKSSLGKSQEANVNHLVDLLNNHSKNSIDAEGHLINFITDAVPEPAQSRVVHIIDKHMPAIRRTFGE